MSPIELLVLLFVATIPLIAFARRANIPYPVVLVLGGLVLGFIPGLPRIQLDPDLVLVLFLPALLYWESVTAPTDEMRANAAWLWSLAVGLVIATTIAVAVVAHAIVPGMSWAVAFVLGALVAPTDETAVIPTLERFRIPRRLMAIIEGESLLNDAGSLIIYTAAVHAVATGQFSWSSALVQFVLAGAGAVIIGFVAGWLAVQGWRYFDSPQIQGIISFTLPFAAYAPALRLGWSGVLAVVAAGVYVNRYTPRVITPMARLRGLGFWDTIVFFANIVIFLLVGLQLHGITTALAHSSRSSLIVDVVAVNGVIIVLRFIWVFAQGEILRACGLIRGSHRQLWAREVIGAWSGVRGGVSLAAALAIPTVIAAGQPFPNRDLLIFLTFSTILVTLVGGALTLPIITKRLQLPDDDVTIAEEQRARGAMAAAALAQIADLERQGQLDAEAAATWRRRYERQRSRAAGAPPATTALAAQIVAAEQSILDAERSTLIALRDRGDIDNVVLRELQLILDLEQVQLDQRL